MSGQFKASLLALCLVLALALSISVAAAPNDTIRVSLATDGAQANNAVYEPEISADGRYVTFWTEADNLISDDLNGYSDVFLRDTQTNTTSLVSLAGDGSQSDRGSYQPVLSGDGRYVAFTSLAGNLVTGDNNNEWDIFVRDTQLVTITRVSIATVGTEADESSYNPAITPDGRFVAFWSSATNLVADDLNEFADIFLHDRQSGVTSRVSVDSDGLEADTDSYDPTLSNDGRFIAFESNATNLVSGDTNDAYDVFVHDTQTGDTERISVATNGTQANEDSGEADMSADGRYVAFESDASNLVSGDTNQRTDIFLRDTQTNTTTRLSVASGGAQGNDASYSPSISADGRFVAFFSYASNLVARDTNGVQDIFIHDRVTGETVRVSVDSSGTEANSDSGYPALSANGQYVAFESDATNLVTGDTNTALDIFRRRLAVENTVYLPQVLSSNP